VLSDLGQWELGPGLATNGRRISREPAVLDELKARGVAWLQLTLGGGSPEIHDWFTRRTGSFDCLCRSAELAHARGLHVAWVYIAYRPLAELARMSRVAQAISWEHEGQDYAHKGGIDQCVFLVKPQGEGRAMEDLRPRLSDLASLPPDLTRERFARSFGAGCETEGELVVALCDSGRQVGCLEQDLCGGVSRWVVSSNGDAYPYCHERHPHHLLGNLSADGGLARALERFRGSRPPPALAIRRRGLPELAAAYGDRRSDTLHSGCSLCRTLVARALAKEYP
jgi:MoaA/NifB/PqqE/SkfB family radical SAM enzyme